MASSSSGRGVEWSSGILLAARPSPCSSRAAAWAARCHLDVGFSSVSLCDLCRSTSETLTAHLDLTSFLLSSCSSAYCFSPVACFNPSQQASVSLYPISAALSNCRPSTLTDCRPSVGGGAGRKRCRRTESFVCARPCTRPSNGPDDLSIPSVYFLPPSAQRPFLPTPLHSRECPLIGKDPLRRCPVHHHL